MSNSAFPFEVCQLPLNKGFVALLLILSHYAVNLVECWKYSRRPSLYKGNVLRSLLKCPLQLFWILLLLFNFYEVNILKFALKGRSRISIWRESFLWITMTLRQPKVIWPHQGCVLGRWRNNLKYTRDICYGSHTFQVISLQYEEIRVCNRCLIIYR